MLSYFVDSVYVDLESTWACPYGIFTQDYVGLEVNKPSLLKPYLRSHHHGGGKMRSKSIGL